MHEAGVEVDLPEPLTPPDCDLKEFHYMPMDVKRVLTSETWVLGSSDEKAAALTLWLESWHQVPAASLPDVERMLAHLSQSKTWKKSRDHALRGWIKCSDGRLYHPVVAEKALEAWLEKLVNSFSGSTGNSVRWGIEIDIAAVRSQVIEAANLLRNIAPQSKSLRKKQLVKILSESPPDKKVIAPRSEKTSPPDSLGDRKIREEKEREVNLKTVGNRTDGSSSPVRPSDISAAMRRHSIEAQPADPRIIAAASAGYSVETIEAACAHAKTEKPNERIGPLFVLRIVERWTREANDPRPLARGSPQRRNVHEERAHTIAVLTGRDGAQADANNPFTIDAEARHAS